jgi:hypothetical protein
MRDGDDDRGQGFDGGVRGRAAGLGVGEVEREHDHLALVGDGWQHGCLLHPTAPLWSSTHTTTLEMASRREGATGADRDEDDDGGN